MIPELKSLATRTARRVRDALPTTERAPTPEIPNTDPLHPVQLDEPVPIDGRYKGTLFIKTDGGAEVLGENGGIWIKAPNGEPLAVATWYWARLIDIVPDSTGRPTTPLFEVVGALAALPEQCTAFVQDVTVTCINNEIVLTKTIKYLRGRFTVTDSPCSEPTEAPPPPDDGGGTDDGGGGTPPPAPPPDDGGGTGTAPVTMSGIWSGQLAWNGASWTRTDGLVTYYFYRSSGAWKFQYEHTGAACYENYEATSEIPGVEVHFTIEGCAGSGRLVVSF